MNDEVKHVGEEVEQIATETVSAIKLSLQDETKAAIWDSLVAALEKVLIAKSRATRYSKAQYSISNGKSVMEELRDELQEWKYNLPENLQISSKADALDEAVSNLEEAINHAEEAECVDVEFPGMFG